MLFRRCSSWAVIGLVAVVAPSCANGAEAVTPTIVFRLKSIDGLLADARYVAGLVGQEEQAKQLQGLLNVLAGPKGLAGTGIDTQRPIGLYGVVTPGAIDSYGALLLPVADETTFVEFVKTILGQLQADVSKGTDGVYTVKHPSAPIEVYFTVADRYAYVTAVSKETLDTARRLAPATVLTANDTTAVGLTVRIDQLPDLVKQLALQRVELQMADAKERKIPGETPAQEALRVQTINFVAQQFKTVMTDSQSLEVGVVLDSRADEITAQLSLSAKPGTPLAREMASLVGAANQAGAITQKATDMLGAKDILRVSVEGGETLRLRVTVKGQIIKFGSQLREKLQGGG